MLFCLDSPIVVPQDAYRTPDNAEHFRPARPGDCNVDFSSQKHRRANGTRDRLRPSCASQSDIVPGCRRLARTSVRIVNKNVAPSTVPIAGTVHGVHGDSTRSQSGSRADETGQPTVSRTVWSLVDARPSVASIHWGNDKGVKRRSESPSLPENVFQGESVH
jgi:hypothetical protein